MFAELLTKVGVYAIIQMFTLIFTENIGFTHSPVLWIAALTMVTGVLGVAAQTTFRRLLPFHIVSQIGYRMLGLALYTSLALMGAVFYRVHHMIVKVNLFLVVGAASRTPG
ncbi:Multiple resistance and pH homeostasis protein D [Jannaschia seosinensis]|uniref:Multiple resistance and pH homeostasis protein D n=1 Tax=Jannaschia seosinensis TaxID=313367 RepID=A0A0M7BDX6_9RHOB|nr:Multiple resistance and pH homeostasis protein D [Jannaschia seosinensis]